MSDTPGASGTLSGYSFPLSIRASDTIYLSCPPPPPILRQPPFRLWGSCLYLVASFPGYLRASDTCSASNTSRASGTISAYSFLLRIRASDSSARLIQIRASDTIYLSSSPFPPPTYGPASSFSACLIPPRVDYLLGGDLRASDTSAPLVPCPSRTVTPACARLILSIYPPPPSLLPRRALHPI